MNKINSSRGKLPDNLTLVVVDTAENIATSQINLDSIRQQLSDNVGKVFTRVFIAAFVFLMLNFILSKFINRQPTRNL